MKATCSTNAAQFFGGVFSPSSRLLLADVARETETSTNPLWSGAGATIKMVDPTENNGTPPRVGTRQKFDKPEQYVTNYPNQLNRKDREKLVAQEMRAKSRARVAEARKTQIATAKRVATRDKVRDRGAHATGRCHRRASIEHRHRGHGKWRTHSHD